ncbi:MAG TPA: SAM-dependent methyltransferase [Actinoallomurus sp.]|jgi:hypothetical protein
MPDVHNLNPAAGGRPVGQFDGTKASPARIYNYLLGGKDNFKADRDAAEDVESRLPTVREMMRENRAFLGRVVWFLATECGIRQFLDIGSGLPTQGNVHEIAQQAAPDARVVYVDNDPIVLTHGRALLATNERTTVLTADLRAPDSILSHPHLWELIDPDKPVAVLLVAVLHFIPDQDKPTELVRTFRSWAAPGSYLALSHVDHTPQVVSAAQVYERATSPAVPRSRGEVEEFFGKFDLVSPGLVQVSAWRPYGRFKRRVDVPWWGGVARHPGAGVTDV